MMRHWGGGRWHLDGRESPWRGVGLATLAALSALLQGPATVIGMVQAPTAEPATAERPGPRPLPTFIGLELDLFPRPAHEACAGHTHIVDVMPPGTIASALAAADPGTLIRVAPGTYTENPSEPTALTWESDGVCLMAADGGEVVLQAAPGQKYGLDLRGSDAVLEGFTLRGFEAAIGLWSSGGHTQRHVTIERTRIERLTGTSREGVIAYGDNRDAPGRPPTVDGLLLLDVTIDGADIGVSCNAGPCAHWWIERTDVHGRRGADSSGSDAFAVEDGRQVVIVDSIAENAAGDGIDLKADDGRLDR